MPDLAELRRIVEAHFRVYEAREQVHKGHIGARFFHVMVPAGEFDRRYELVRADMHRLYPDLLTFVRREAGEDIICVAERPPAPRLRLGLHLGLFLATVATTIVAGAMSWHGYTNASADASLADVFSAHNLAMGALTFALPLVLILGIHEMAHFVAARRHGLRPTLPFFIPAPPIVFPIGTFGAYISMRDPLPDRKALFDVGVSGPIAGFIVALPILILGSMLTAAGAHAVPDIGRPGVYANLPYELDNSTAGQSVLRFDHPPAGVLLWNVTGATNAGDDWTYTSTARVTFANGTVASDELAARALSRGQQQLQTLTIPADATSAELILTWDDRMVRFGDPLLVILLHPVWPENANYLTHPVFLAGWVGLLIAGINLLPVGQLDGGHVSRALLGDKSIWLARAAFGALVMLALFFFDSWMFFAFFVFFMGLQHPPPLNDRTKIEGRRIAVAVLVVVIFLVSFIPVPIQV